MSLRACVAVALCCSAIACGGDDGKDGKSALTHVVPASPAECPTGGSTIQAGQDANGNGVLDAGEVTSTSSVCDGDDMGGPWLTSTADADFATCPWGGTVLSFGKDLDANDVLAATEILSTRAVCNSTVTANAGFATWTGAGADNLWSNPANWDTGERPSPGNSLRFPPDAARLTSVNDLQTLHAVNGLDILGGHQLSGNQLTILGAIYADAAGNQLDLPLHMRTQNVTTADAESELRLSGVITGAELGKLGLGRVVLTGVNGYTRLTTLAEGELRVEGGQALPDAAAFFCNSGTLVVGDAETIGDLDGSCAMALEADLASVVTEAVRTYSGIMSGAGVFIKRGAQTLVLSGTSNGHTGALRVEAGMLAVNSSYGASPTTVAQGGTLAGTGNVGGVTAAAGAIVHPGNGTGPGNLTASGNTTFAAGSTFRIALNGTVSGTQYSRLSVLNNIDLGGATLAGTVGFAPASGNTFDIIQCGGTVTGTFDGHANGSTVTLDGREFTITYTAQAVRLTKT